MWSESPNIPSNLSNSCIVVGSWFWLFRDLSLQEGYPQSISRFRMGVSLVEEGHDDDNEDVDAAAGRWGLVWDPEDGPVWGNIGGIGEEKQEDTWTQLLREGVNGIITDRDGGDRNYVCCVCALSEK